MVIRQAGGHPFLRERLCYFENTLLPHFLQVSECSERNGLLYEFIEVKVVPNQELQSLCLEQHRLVVELRPRKHIEAEWPHYVFNLLRVPLKGA